MPFQKGKSGNPSGRPKGVTEITLLCRNMAPKIIARLEQIVLHSEDEAAVTRAAQILLERGCGKPVQPHAGPDAVGPVQIICKWENEPQEAKE